MSDTDNSLRECGEECVDTACVGIIVNACTHVHGLAHVSVLTSVRRVHRCDTTDTGGSVSAS